MLNNLIKAIQLHFVILSLYGMTLSITNKKAETFLISCQNKTLPYTNSRFSCWQLSLKSHFILNVFWEIVPHSHFIGHLKLTKCKWWRLFGARKWSTASNSFNCKNWPLKYDTNMTWILNFNSDYNGDKDADICDSKEKKQSYVLFSDDIEWVKRFAETNFSQWNICYECNLVQAYHICN